MGSEAGDHGVEELRLVEGLDRRGQGRDHRHEVRDPCDADVEAGRGDPGGEVDGDEHDLADAAPKWSALARYAQDHPDRVRRVLAVARTSSGELRALDLTADAIADKVALATNKDLLEALFASDGYAY